MSQAPLPPHERTWRHPSELAAAEREAARIAAPANGARVLAMATGSVGLLAVGMLVMSVAPRGADGPLAVSATTTPGAVSTFGASGVAAIGRFASDADGETDTPMHLAPALATPIGDGRSALVTLEGARRSEGAFDVRLTSGTVVNAAVLDTTENGLVVVTIATSKQAHMIASEPPDPDEIVTVLASPPVTVPFHQVAEMEMAEGTPVLDADGALVGLCTRSGGRPAVLDVTGHHRARPEAGSSAPGDVDAGWDDGSVPATTGGPDGGEDRSQDPAATTDTTTETTSVPTGPSTTGGVSETGGVGETDDATTVAP